MYINDIDAKIHYGFIYITINNVNGMKYIGQRKFNQGWKYYLGSGTYLKNAIKKYGRKNFTRNIIAIACSKEELDDLEIKFIEKYNAVENECYYNIADGGMSGNKFAGKSEEEMKEFSKKISEINKGENSYNYGKHHSEETKKKMSESRSGAKNPFYGKHLSEEHKEKIRNSNTGKIASEEARLKMSQSRSGKNNPNYGKDFFGENNPFYGRKHSKESKSKMSESHTGIFCDEKHPMARSVICITTGETFKLIKYASEKYCVLQGSISQCCNGKKKSAGKHPVTNEKLVWAYY